MRGSVWCHSTRASNSNNLWHWTFTLFVLRHDHFTWYSYSSVYAVIWVTQSQTTVTWCFVPSQLLHVKTFKVTRIVCRTKWAISTADVARVSHSEIQRWRKGNSGTWRDTVFFRSNSSVFNLDTAHPLAVSFVCVWTLNATSSVLLFALKYECALAGA